MAIYGWVKYKGIIKVIVVSRKVNFFPSFSHDAHAWNLIEASYLSHGKKKSVLLTLYINVLMSFISSRRRRS